jgi:hypothetical protein
VPTIFVYYCRRGEAESEVVDTQELEPAAGVEPKAERIWA